MKTSKIITLASLFCATFLAACVNASPSFDCTKVKNSSIEQLICSDGELSELDRKLSTTFKEAEANASKNLPTLKATQRGWIKGRNDCWKEDDQRDCVLSNYKMRISELQAGYGLVKASNSSTYSCANEPESLLSITYFPTEIPTAKVTRGEQESFMYKHSADGATLYKGPNESVAVHKNHVKVTWGYDAKEVQCSPLSKTAQ